MTAHPTFVSQLLKIYHRGKPAGAGPIDLPTIDQIKYLCDVGLGAIAFQVYGDDFRQSDPTLFSVLHSADLTTRVIYGQIDRATAELAFELQGAGVVPTFLKGISTSEEFYAPPYLRVMGDIDLLIQPSEVDLVMAKIADLGYETTDEQWRMHGMGEHHHRPAVRHPSTGVTIEVHTGLFSSAEYYSGEHVFQPDTIAGQMVEFDYRGARVARFSPEFQFIYTVSKWSADRDWTVNLKNINDAIHILRKYESGFDWPTLSKWFAASPHLCPIITALLDYLEQAEILPVSPRMRKALAVADRKSGSRTSKLLGWLLHTFPFNAREKTYGGGARWFAHALWLYSTKPTSRDLGIPRSLVHQFYMSALYGKYSPIHRALSGLRVLVHRVRGTRNRSTCA